MVPDLWNCLCHRRHPRLHESEWNVAGNDLEQSGGHLAARRPGGRNARDWFRHAKANRIIVPPISLSRCEVESLRNGSIFSP